jgi:hypothetical protein
LDSDSNVHPGGFEWRVRDAFEAVRNGASLRHAAADHGLHPSTLCIGFKAAFLPEKPVQMNRIYPLRKRSFSSNACSTKKPQDALLRKRWRVLWR